MKELRTCFLLWTKRILKRPLFLFTLLLMPCAVLFLQNCQTEDDALLNVALYTSGTDAESEEMKLLSQLISLSNRSIHFYKCDSKEQLLQDVTSGYANCGYLIPEHLDDALQKYAKDHTPFLTTIRPKKEITTNIVDEIVLSKSYKEISYYIVRDFLNTKTGNTLDNAQLQKLFEKHSSSELLFQFEYADGAQNELLNQSETNFMLMPIRGIVAVLVLLSCMSGALVWYSDQKNKLLLLIPDKKQQLFRFFSLFVPGLFAACAGIITIFLTGIAENPLKEILLMTVYLLACISLVNLLRNCCSKREYFLATIPFFLLASLILCPVFVDIRSFSAGLANINKLLPATYYLYALHSTEELLWLLTYAILAFALSCLVRKIRTSRP